MIRYALRCDKGHGFESWFPSSAAYDSQVKRKLVNCPQCGSIKVQKAIMAPQIARTKGRDRAPEPVAAEAQAATTPEATATPGTTPEPISTPLLMAQERELRTKLKSLRDHITKTADNVGQDFPNEARKMHYGETKHRPIYGEASTEDARALIEEGIEVAPLPVLPGDRN
jgi:hypothetical protein